MQTYNKLTRYRSGATKVKSRMVGFLPLLRPYGFNISVSHSHKFVWFRVAKVGTRTLLDEFNKSNIETVKSHQRMIPYSSGMYSGYLKFAFVRNPWSRLVSCWKNKVVDANAFNLEVELLEELRQFPAFVAYVKDLDLAKTDVHLRLQSTLIDHENISFLGKFENFVPDVIRLFDCLGETKETIGRKNTSIINPGVYKQYYTSSEIKEVEKMYIADVELFGYKY